MREKDEVYSNAVKAGKRTYFFDVKTTKKDDLYITITESKKLFNDDGTCHFEKHKIFLYKEDFEKFADGLYDAVSFIREVYEGTIGQEAKSDVNVSNTGTDLKANTEDLLLDDAKFQEEFSNVEFDDLNG